MGKIRKIVEVDRMTLRRIDSARGSIRGGSTINPHQRAAAYQSPSGGGYSGTMFVSRTNNMMTDEDAVLNVGAQSGRGRHNAHRFSNAPAAPGFSYVINGRKMN
jgi:hypothetical protein